MVGAFTQQLDLPLLLLILFFLFFLGLVYYLHGEDKREGYPLESERSDRTGGRVKVVGFPPIPKPKRFLVRSGMVYYAPRERDRRELNAVPAHNFPGAPLVPTGDPLVDGIGPAAYALREDTPDLTWAGDPKLQPMMRKAPQYRVEETETHPLGLPVYTSDGHHVGEVTDVWINKHEFFVRYFEVRQEEVLGGRLVLAPIAAATVRDSEKTVVLETLTREQFANVPSLAGLDQITMREEDRINAYYAGGRFFAKNPIESMI
ncbi:photosynthetic reaction center subunit H [Pararhizobium mangrovi]|uniref:Photosynthetic reaction center subunit H n=1 Tax=Pararhizobium mangrovi TaxID=2590452 RepID=A0A506UCM3_9HYPH|nr:photosynthetic reaction center subunit H [Pararhizobium mangrovi]TPW30419.1 photosynthetic reaction center subunit H [Pararhizobium mangrovi]